LSAGTGQANQLDGSATRKQVAGDRTVIRRRNILRGNFQYERIPTVAGSYNHIVEENGALRGIDSLENWGDMYEAIEECFGMIWYLANGDADKVEEARRKYRKGLELAPQR